MLSRLLVVSGAAATIAAAFLPWVTISGLGATFDLGLIGADVSAGDRTVAGTDTALWPALVGAAIAGGALGLLGVARRVLALLGLLTAVAGGLLVYYMANVVELETRDDGALKRAAGRALLDSSIGVGTPLLLAGGLLILMGALARR